jgi:hypothetical protein
MHCATMFVSFFLLKMGVYSRGNSPHYSCKLEYVCSSYDFHTYTGQPPPRLPRLSLCSPRCRFTIPSYLLSPVFTHSIYIVFPYLDQSLFSFSFVSLLLSLSKFIISACLPRPVLIQPHFMPFRIFVYVM